MASREPTVEMRRRARKDGSYSEEPTVRYYDEMGVRRRKACATPEEADFERARLALEQSRTGPVASPVEGAVVRREPAPARRGGRTVTAGAARRAWAGRSLSSC